MAFGKEEETVSCQQLLKEKCVRRADQEDGRRSGSQIFSTGEEESTEQEKQLERVMPAALLRAMANRTNELYIFIIIQYIYKMLKVMICLS